MAVNCALCGVSMSVAEVTQRPYDGLVGNYHRDCAYLSYLFNSGPVQASSTNVSELNATTITKHIHRKATLAVASIAAPTLALQASTNLGIGAYQYAVTFVDDTTGAQESTPGTIANITTTSGNQGVNLTNSPLGPSPTTLKRRIYRTVVAGAQLKLLTTINDNTTTTFSDTTVDGSLGANAPTVSFFGRKDYP